MVPNNYKTAKSYVGLGLQAGLIHKGVNFDAYTFPNQYDQQQGAFNQSIANQQNFETDFIQTDKKRRSTVKVRIIGNHQQVIRVDKEDRNYLDDESSENISSGCRSDFDHRW